MPTLRRLAAVLAVLCLLAGGGYAIARSAAEAAVAEAIARLRTALGPGAVIEHGAIRAEPIAGRVRISILTVSLDSGNAEAFIVSDVVIDGLRPGGAGFGRLSLHGIRILQGAEERGRIGSMTIEGLTLPAEPGFSLADSIEKRLGRFFSRNLLTYRKGDDVKPHGAAAPEPAE